MKVTRLEKGLVIGLVIILIISSLTAAFLIIHINKTSHNDEELDDKKELLEPGVKSLIKEFTFSEPVIDDYGEYANVYVQESDFNSISDGWPVLPVNLTTLELPFGTNILDISYDYSTPELISLSKKLITKTIFKWATNKGNSAGKTLKSSLLWPADSTK